MIEMSEEDRGDARSALSSMPKYAAATKNDNGTAGDTGGNEAAAAAAADGAGDTAGDSKSRQTLPSTSAHNGNTNTQRKDPGSNAKPNNQHQHASAALLLDLAASATAASGSQTTGDGHSATTTKPGGLGHRQMSDPTGGGPAIVNGVGATGSSYCSRGASTSHPTAQLPQAHLSAAFPPRFDEIGSPFVHAADYAAGMAIRDYVIDPVLTAIGGRGEIDAEEASLVTTVDDYIRGKTIRLERTIGQQKDGQSSKTTDIVEAQILPVSCRDAPIVASWYNTHGDKTLSYTTKAWSDWWIQRCGHPDAGCEMIKLVTSDDHAGEGHNGQENILAVAYFERSLADRHAVEADKSVEEKEEEDGKDNVVESDGPDLNEKAKKRRRDATDTGIGTPRQRTVQTTLLRGIRVNPNFNPEVTRRFKLQGRGTESACGSNELVFMGIPAALVTYILAQSLRYGTEALGVNCPKLDSAESFFEAMFGGCNNGGDIAQRNAVPEDIDGRKYFRLRGDYRWEVLRAAIERQVILSQQIWLV